MSPGNRARIVLKGSPMRACESENLPIFAHTLCYPRSFGINSTGSSPDARHGYVAGLLPRVSPIGYDMRR
jgi:hypothetical protein